MKFFIFKSSNPETSKEEFMDCIAQNKLKLLEKCFLARVVNCSDLLSSFSVEELSNLIELYPKILIEDNYGNTILHALITHYFGSFEQGEHDKITTLIKRMCSDLIQRNISINHKRTSGYTPLHIACALGLKELKEILIKFGA